MVKSCFIVWFFFGIIDVKFMESSFVLICVYYMFEFIIVVGWWLVVIGCFVLYDYLLRFGDVFLDFCF